MSYFLTITYKWINGVCEDKIYLIANSLFDSVKRALLDEIELNISLAGTLHAKTYYTSVDYMNKIKKSTNISLPRVIEEHYHIRKEFLGKIGKMYENCGYMINFGKGSKL